MIHPDMIDNAIEPLIKNVFLYLTIVQLLLIRIGRSGNKGCM